VGVPLRGDIDETLDHLRHLEGVQTVAAAVGPMVDRSNTMSVIGVRGRSMPVAFKSVTPDYFDVVGSRLLAGRSLTARDRNGVAVVVNETFARRFGSSEGALGVVLSGSPPSEVVGVVRDTFDVALDAAPAPTVFVLLEAPWADCVGSCTNVVHYVLRAQIGSRSLDAAVQREVARVNHAAVIAEISPMRTRLVGSIRDKSFATLIFTLFAATSLAVCVAGLVGIVAFTVARRTREIAIRVAIGATPRNVLWMVCHEALRAAMAGAVAGALIGGWLSRTLQHFLYGVQPGDVSTLIVSAAGMLTLSATAAAITASRALRRSPVDALRVE